jgi:hypothetical protein
MIYISIIIGFVLWIGFFWVLTNLMLSKEKISWALPFFLVASISFLYSTLIIFEVSLEGYASILGISFLLSLVWISINIWRFENAAGDE